MSMNKPIVVDIVAIVLTILPNMPEKNALDWYLNVGVNSGKIMVTNPIIPRNIQKTSLTLLLLWFSLVMFISQNIHIFLN